MLICVQVEQDPTLKKQKMEEYQKQKVGYRPYNCTLLQSQQQILVSLTPSYTIYNILTEALFTNYVTGDI